MRGTKLTTDVLKTAATLVLVLAAGACSDDATGPDGGGAATASATMHDSPNGASGSLQQGFSKTYAQTSGSASYSGSMQADVQVQVSADGSTWTDVNEQATSSTRVDFHSSSETTVASEATVESGTYSHVRIVMENTSATVDAGSSFGASVGGLTLEADLTLDMGSSGRVVIEKEVGDFQVSADSNTTITTDVNSEAWVNQENVEAEAVTAAEIESATVVTVE